MIIKKKNAGNPISYKQDGNILTFRDGELVLDLERLQDEYLVHIDICEDPNGKLVVGSSRKYVAEIDLPPREYRMIKLGFKCDANLEQLRRDVVPFDIDKVVLTLWSVGDSDGAI